MATQNVTTRTSIAAALIKELRIERRVTQAQLADKIGRTPSYMAKVESGKSGLQLDDFFQLCAAMFIQPPYICSAIEQHAQFLTSHGWHVMLSKLDSSEDDLIRLAPEYYASPGYKRREWQISNNFGLPITNVLNSPYTGSDNLIYVIDVFRFVVDDKFKQHQLLSNENLLTYSV